MHRFRIQIDEAFVSNEDVDDTSKSYSFNGGTIAELSFQHSIAQQVMFYISLIVCMLTFFVRRWLWDDPFRLPTSFSGLHMDVKESKKEYEVRPQ